MRKLVTVRTITKITPIPDADKIECAHIDGWTVVVGKNEFFEGQNVFYFEIDSMLPLDNSLFEFLESRGITIQNSKKYHRLRTMRLRGQLSQGLILPYSTLNKLIPYESKRLEVEKRYQEDNEGDFSEFFKVVKYEPPIPMCLQGEVSEYPVWLSTPDEERIQNFSQEQIQEILSDKDNWIPTEKIDGTSISFYAYITEEGVLKSGVCSKNWSIVENEDNTYWKVFKKPRIKYEGSEQISIQRYLQLKCLEEARATTWGSNTPCYVLQGELFGEGIQGNRYKQKGQTVRFFNFFQNHKQISIEEIQKQHSELTKLWVPILNIEKNPSSLEEFISSPDNINSNVNPELKQIEGIVWRHRTKTFLNNKNTKASFKTISNKYLLRYE